MATTNELLSEVSCFSCYGMSEAELTRIALMRRTLLVQDPDADVSPDSLISAGRCYGCSGYSLARMIEQVLWDRLLATAGGGGECPAPAEALFEWEPSNAPMSALNFGIEHWDNDGTAVNGLTSLTSHQTVAHYVELDGAPTLQSLNFPELTNLVSSMFLLGNPVIQTVSAPLLSSFGSSITIDNSPALTSVNLASLTNIGTDLVIRTNSSLATVTIGVVSVLGVGIHMNDNALTVASVNHVLAQCEAGGLLNKTLRLDGGTNAAPAGQGIVDKNTLIARGWAVTTN